ncbi:MAG: alpha/beta hydrolase, partial [Bacteroidales bacterium]|nr:alpha/beta hydrolase [Bacteroidales bacterium]
TYSYMRDMRVISIDLPGHGKSDTFSEVHTMEFMAETVKAVLDAANVEECVMLGHSMGGYVTLAFAEKYSYLLRGFGLIHSQAMADSNEVVKQRLESIETAKANRPGYILDFITSLFDESKRGSFHSEIKEVGDISIETTLEGIAAAQRGMADRPSRLHILENAEMPVLFIFGTNDKRIPIEMAMAQATLPSYSEILMIDKVGHLSFIEERDFVKLRIKNFVNSCYL